MAQMPNYEWSEVRGVIRFMPKQGRSTVFKELLNVRIETVTIETGVLIKVIRMELAFLTEIAEFYERNKLVRKQFFVVGNSHKPLRQTIEMKNCTFEELLNEIVRVKGGGWLLRYSKQDTASEGARVIDLVL
ncbi:MAG: hypothetical protein IPJ30_16280 [Acidobacteria bacterium]|nr:hypothetical protein [Acidobacteriota bacterium]